MAHNRLEIKKNKEESEKIFIESLHKYFENQRILETETEEIENLECVEQAIEPKNKKYRSYLLFFLLFLICFSVILWRIFHHDDGLKANILTNINDFEKIF